MRTKRPHYAALWLCVDNSSSEDKNTILDLQAPSNLTCQCQGMQRRVRHLRTCQSVAPADLAASEIASQRSFEKRLSGSEILSMSTHKDKMSGLSRASVPLSEKMALPFLGMAKTPPPPSRTLYRERLGERMLAARKRKDYTQKEMGAKLGMTTDAYRKAEDRGALWADLIEPFADATGEDPFYMLTGRRVRVMPATEEVAPKKAKRPAKRRA